MALTWRIDYDLVKVFKKLNSTITIAQSLIQLAYLLLKLGIKAM
jgi:hypothetical protein